VVNPVGVSRALANIRRPLAINRVGRLRLIMEPRDQVPAGRWAHMLARSSCDPDGIFCALCEKPDIVPTCSSAHHDGGSCVWVSYHMMITFLVVGGGQQNGSDKRGTAVSTNTNEIENRRYF
jgi:hypothetical protein